MFRYPICLLSIVVLLSLAACERNASVDAAQAPARDPASTIAPAPPPAPKNLPVSWPAGDAITLALPPDTGANSLTKALYERGDIVLEQTWPDGTRERWWHATDGSTRYIGRDGIERMEATP